MSTPTITPPAVRNAALAVWAILALVVLRVALTFAFEDDLIDAWVETRSSNLPRELQAETAPSYTGVAIGILVIGVVLAIAAANLGKGAKWARIVVYVFASLNIVGIVVSFVVPSLLVLMVINAVVGLLAVAAIVLLSTGDANRFFAS